MRGLMNSCAPISGLVCPSRGQPRDLGLLGRQDVARLRGEPARGLAGGEELAAGALGERFGPHAAEALVGGAQGSRASARRFLAAQPLAVQEPGARELDRRRGCARAARSTRGSRATRRRSAARGERASMPSAQSVPLARVSFAQALERVGGLAGAGRRGRRPRSARPAPSRTPHVLVLAAPAAPPRAPPRSGRGRCSSTAVGVAIMLSAEPWPRSVASWRTASSDERSAASSPRARGEHARGVRAARCPVACADRVGLLDQRRGRGELPGEDVERGAVVERDREHAERAGLAGERARRGSRAGARARRPTDPARRGTPATASAGPPRRPSASPNARSARSSGATAAA